jgi:hypothetical protein
MEPRTETKVEKATLRVTELESRETPSVAIDVLGLATVDVHLDLQTAITTPLGLNVDLNLTL